MWYQLKSIFRNNITWTVLAIIVILNLYTMINLEREAYNSRSKMVTDIELRIIENKGILSSSKTTAARFDDPKYWEWIENEGKFLRWLIKSDDRRIEIYKNLDPKGYSDELLTMDIIEAMYTMDSDADPEEGRPFSNNVFKEDMKSLKLKGEFPYSREKLALVQWNVKENRPFFYNWGKTTVERLFNLYKTKEKRLETYTASPWSFYVKTVGSEGFSVPVLCTIVLVYTCAMVVEDRKNRSMQLVKVLPKNGGYVFGHYYTSILLSVFIILIISFLIPILFMGIRHGFGGLKDLILVDPNGFISFNGYNHLDVWGTFGIGRFATPSIFPANAVLFSTQLVLYPLWKVMGLSMILTILKLLFLILIGVGVGLCISNKTTAILVTSLVSVIYIISQLYGANMVYNPLSIGSAWNITLGGMAFTWLRAVLVLITALIVGTTAVYTITNKQDFNV